MTVFNDPPFFKSAGPQNLKIRMNKITTFKLPDYDDKEKNNIFVSPSVMPKFCTYLEKFYKCQPKQLGDYDVEGSLSDGMAEISYKFTLTVFNDRPMF